MICSECKTNNLHKKEEGTFTSTVKPSRTESEDSDIIIDQNGTRKNKHNFW